MTLDKVFMHTVLKYTDNHKMAEALWHEIEQAYTSAERAYHTLDHLNNLVEALTEFKALILEWDTIVFSIFYHDIIYNTVKHNNEEKSAAIAHQRLTAINFSKKNLKRCIEQILATKEHQQSDDEDTNLFTDADLAILGAPWEKYVAYAKNIRKEYAFHPDTIYKPGRRKVVSNFLNMPRVFKTEAFFLKYETQARQNLIQELTILL